MTPIVTGPTLARRWTVTGSAGRAGAAPYGVCRYSPDASPLPGGAVACASPESR
jgi:hypothetical protein